MRKKREKSKKGDKKGDLHNKPSTTIIIIAQEMVKNEREKFKQTNKNRKKKQECKILDRSAS